MHTVGHLLLSVLGVTTPTRNLLGLDYSVSSSLTAEENIYNITKSNIVRCVFVSNEADGSDVACSRPGCDAGTLARVSVQLLGV